MAPSIVTNESAPADAAPYDSTQLIVNLGQDDLARLKASQFGLTTSESASHHEGSVDNSSGHNTSTSGQLSDDDDYDVLSFDPSTVVQGGTGGGLQKEPALERIHQFHSHANSLSPLQTSDESIRTPPPIAERKRTRRKSIPIKLQRTGTKGKYLLSADDPEIREILRRGVQREIEGQTKKKRSRFSDLVFTRQFTAFDRQNPNSASAPFHGFFTLFWLSIFLLLVKVAANNWKQYGSVFGPNQILAMMFHRDVIVLGLTDGVLCASTVFCLILQKVIVNGWMSWNGAGWIMQHIWQTLYLAATISWTIHRSWPWTHTVFIVIHCIAMLMKQHSYAFYNGYLSGLYKRKKMLERRLKQLEEVEEDSTSLAKSPSSPTAIASSYFESQNLDTLHRRRRSQHSLTSQQVRKEQSDIASVSAAIESGLPLDLEQISAFERIIQWEIDTLDEELKGKCSDTSNVYPKNLNIKDFAGYIPLPTVVYELEYPRQEHIDWLYIAEKTAATFGVIGVMIVVSQAYIYPSVMTTLHMKEQGMSIQERLKEFPWVLSDLLFPFMMEYLLAWYLIWECILNVLAELTLFADRGFYADWWNSTSWDQFARDWNRPVHNFLLRHVYHSSISAFRVSRPIATFITFFLSACVHELVMWCIFKKARGYLMAMQMLQLPLVILGRWWGGRGGWWAGNLLFWVGIFTGPSFLCSLYLII